MRKGQAPVIEYVALLFIMALIITFVIFMVFGFQFMVAGSGKAQETEERSLFVLQSMLSSGALGSPKYQSISVLEDAKLTALSEMECADFEALYGSGAFVNVTLFIEMPDCEGLSSQEYYDCKDEERVKSEMQAEPCTGDSYPDCGTWVLCPDSLEKRMVYRSVAVSIYRKMGNRLALGVLTVGIPSGGGT